MASLLLQIQQRFWANAYPRLEPDDPESRYGPYDFLNSEKVLPLLIRSLPLTGGGGRESYCYSDFASMTQNDELIRKNPDVARQALRGQNKIVSEDWERAVAQTPRTFYEELTAVLTECLEALMPGRRARSISSLKGPEASPPPPACRISDNHLRLAGRRRRPSLKRSPHPRRLAGDTER